MMKISVKTLDSQTKVFTKLISEEITVKEFKEHIASEVNIPADKQRLIFKGKVLQGDKKLSEYGADGCVIHLVERKPQPPGASSQDGANGASSTTTSSTAQGGLFGPNIVMGAFSMPVDVVGATQVFPHNFMRREVQALVVYCTFKDDGCKWKGEVRHLESHNNSCAFLKIPCLHPECGMLVKKADLPEHLENECSCRQDTCGFCKKQIDLNRMQHHHEKECPAYRVVCEKCNKDGIRRAMLLEHQDPVVGDCDGVQAPCPFSQIGCSKTEVLSPRQKKEHVEKENAYHTTLLLHHGLRMGREMEALLMRDPRIMSRSPHIFTNYDGIISDILSQIQTSTAENRDLQEKCREHSERITSLERKVASGNFSAAARSTQVSGDSNSGVQNTEITRRVINVENRTADHEVHLVENNHTIEQANRDIGTVRRQVDNTIRRLERIIDSSEHSLALRNVTFADFEEYIRQEFSSHDGQLLWRITEYARKRNDAVSGRQVSFYSPSFYTSRYGYKMRARIYLNGDGMGRGTHISVFVVIMRGQWDALLRWPFTHKVTFILMDQDNVEHVINSFRPDPSSSSFQRPRREMNIASGCPMFCSLTELNNRAYVRDNTMFLKITVDTSNLEDCIPQQLDQQEITPRLRQVTPYDARQEQLRSEWMGQIAECKAECKAESARGDDDLRMEFALVHNCLQAEFRQLQEQLSRGSNGDGL